MGKIIHVLLYALLVLVLIWGSKVFLQTSYIDFRVYYEAAINTKLLGNPYLASDPNMSYLYPPVTILLFLPLTFVSVVVAEKIWLVISLIFFFLAISFLFTLLRISWKSYEGLLYLILCVIFFPFKFTLGMGQINMLILFFLVLFLYYYEKRKALAGFFLGLATVIKISPFLMLLYLFYRKQWIIMCMFFITLLSAGIVSLIFFPRPTEFYVGTLLPSLSQAWPLGYYNQSITGFLGRLPYPVISLIIIRWISVIALLFITIGGFKKNLENGELLKISSIFPVLLLISSFSWQHHFVLLIPSFLILSHFTLTSIKLWKEKVILLTVILLSYLLIGYNIKHPELVPILLQSHVFYGTFLLWGLHLYIIQKK